MSADWLTTVPNPRRPATGHDAGVTGWKLHIVPDPMEIAAPTGTVVRGTALCGLNPTYGWGLDAFVVDRCKRCVAKLAKQTPLTTKSL